MLQNTKDIVDEVNVIFTSVPQFQIYKCGTIMQIQGNNLQQTSIPNCSIKGLLKALVYLASDLFTFRLTYKICDIHSVLSHANNRNLMVTIFKYIFSEVGLRQSTQKANNLFLSCSK